MAYLPHNYLVFAGTLGTGASSEVFQFGVRVSNAFTSQADRLAWLNAKKTDFTTWFASSDARHRLDATLTTIRLNPIGPNGKYSEAGSNIVTVSQAGATGLTVPAFLCSVISWNGPDPRVLAGRGRIYPPNAPALATAGSSRQTTASAAQLKNAGQALLNIISAPSAGVSAFPIIASSQGATQNIVGVRVGDVIDVVRRRKNKLREVYS